jgi:hypothetical protein
VENFNLGADGPGRPQEWAKESAGPPAELLPGFGCSLHLRRWISSVSWTSLCRRELTHVAEGENPKCLLYSLLNWDGLL